MRQSMRSHVDSQAGVVRVERSYTFGKAKAYGKTARSRRRVPLSTRALSALDAIPRRLDTRLIFTSPRGEHVDLPTGGGGSGGQLEAAGLPHRRVYDLRHTFATWALDAGLSLFEVSRYMGTSVEMIDRTLRAPGDRRGGHRAGQARRLRGTSHATGA
jgi:integrase